MREFNKYLLALAFITNLFSCTSYHENKFRLNDLQGQLVNLDSVDSNGCIFPQKTNRISKKRNYGIIFKVKKNFYSNKKQKKLSLGVQRGLDGTDEDIENISICLYSKNTKIDVTNLLYSNYNYGKISKLFFEQYKHLYNTNCINLEYFNDIHDFISQYNANNSDKILGEALNLDTIFLLQSDSIPEYITSESVTIKINFKTISKK